MVSDKPWNGSASRFTPEQWKSSCILHKCEGMEKSCHSLPIKEPGGELSRSGVHAAASRIGSVTGASDAQVASAKSALRSAYKSLGEDVPDSLTAAGAADVSENSLALMAIPAAEDEVHGIGDEPKHVTLLYLGECTDQECIDALHAVAEQIAGTLEPFNADVAGTGSLGPNGAKVAFLNNHDLSVARGMAEQDPAINAHLGSIDTHPNFIPHMTITYGDDDIDSVRGRQVTFDRMSVWHGDQQTDYPLGEAMKPGPDEQVTPPQDAPVEEEDKKKRKRPDGGPVPPEHAPGGFSAVPVHGVLAPEGVKTGDGRRFLEGSLRTVDTPFPLTWQKAATSGHDGNVAVAKVEQVMRVANEIRYAGHTLANAEADEVIGLIGEFGKYGVSVDADDNSFDVNEDEDCVDFSDARIRSACIVSIPAFVEAYISLGEAPEGFFDGGTSTMTDQTEEALVASIEAMFEPYPETVNIFKDLAPGRTEDGPGWLTHPVDTNRLRDYWAHGEGAAKIGWGTPGDFNRCRANLAKYVKPQYLAGYCANRHYDALGFWPGRPVAGDTEGFAYENLGIEDPEPAEAISLVASAPIQAPAAWFKDPELSEPTPLTVTDEGRVFGHIAQWGTCHIGFAGECVDPPHSATNYAHFLGGQVALDDGTRAATGSITIGTGHAGKYLSARRAVEHYDNTGTAVCDITCGEDDIGIWMAGWVRPGVTDEQVTALMASKVSGDWRQKGLDLEMVAVLAVNVQGFGVARPRVAARDGQQVSLVAAGMVAEQTPTQTLDAHEVAVQVADILEQRARDREAMGALRAKYATTGNGVNAGRPANFTITGNTITGERA
jgi:2'-5' RNA ligase